MSEQKKRVCYAIMPYGGDDENLKGRFNMVYQLFMMIPAGEEGFILQREDFNPQSGTITQNIVRHLAEDDLVIADLSNHNWNVAYELGIRHTLMKGRTVLLCDEKSDLKFDIRGFNVIRYNGDNPSVNMFEIQRKVREAISDRVKSPVKADNIVHETFSFPFDRMIDCMGFNGTETEQQLLKLRNDYAALMDSYSELKKQLEDIENNGESRIPRQNNIAKRIASAFGSMEYSGDKVVLQIREETTKSTPDYTRIQSILEKALTEGYITEANFRAMYRIFIDMPQLRNLILEVAAERYPESLDFKSYLASAYSENYLTREKAIQYADEILQISEIDGKRVSKCKKIDDDQLSACLSAYTKVKRYDVLVEVLPILLQKLPEHREKLLRNLAVVYREMGENEKEEMTIKDLIQEFPMHDINHYIASTYYRRREDNLFQAYCHLLLAAALDINDPDYPCSIAGLIMDERFYIDIHGSEKRLRGKEDCARVVMPFLMHALQNSSTNQCIQQCMDFILRNGLNSYFDHFKNWIDNGMEEKGIPGLDYAGVEYLEKVLNNLTEDICKKMFLENGIGTFE